MDDGRVRVRSRRVSGHTVIDLASDRLALVLAPRLGGRILSVRLDGREFLHRSERLLDDECGAVRPEDVAPHGGQMADWRNWGGDKTWVAPQGWSGPGEWAGPPDPVLDSGEYEAVVARAAGGGHASVTLTSGPDPRTGLRLSRVISLDAGRTAFRLVLTGTNVTGRPVRWSLWNITQLPGHAAGPEGDGVWVGLTGDGPAATALVAGTGNPRVESHGARLAHVPAQDVVGKAGFPRAAGWLAHVGPAGTWAHRFPVDPSADYPDGGARAEVWLEHPLAEPLAHLGGLRPGHRIVECEILGPWVELAPGESTRLDTTVLLGPHGGAVTDVGDTGWWNEPFGISSSAPGTALRLTGRFVPCVSADTPLTVRTAPARPGGGCGPERRHRTEILVRAGEPVDLALLPPLSGVGEGTVIDVLLGDGDDAPVAGSLTW